MFFGFAVYIVRIGWACCLHAELDTPFMPDKCNNLEQSTIIQVQGSSQQVNAYRPCSGVWYIYVFNMCSTCVQQMFNVFIKSSQLKCSYREAFSRWTPIGQAVAFDMHIHVFNNCSMCLLSNQLKDFSRQTLIGQAVWFWYTHVFNMCLTYVQCVYLVVN